MHFKATTMISYKDTYSHWAHEDNMIPGRSFIYLFVCSKVIIRVMALRRQTLRNAKWCCSVLHYCW